MPGRDVPHARRLAVSVLRIQDGLLRVVSGAAGPRRPLSTEVWLEALVTRHTSAFSRPEFLKAVRALSSRYVESRARLTSRSPLDSAGKRAAFAGFYAPLHYLTTRAIVRSLPTPANLSHVVDLGCGTGVAAAAWAGECDSPPAITGVDRSGWALDEMRWNSQCLGLRCRTLKTSLVDWITRQHPGGRHVPLDRTAMVSAWSINELDSADRERALAGLLDLHGRGAAVLVIEPLALSAVPWWESWRTPVTQAGGRTDEWRFPPELPDALATLDDAAGFRREQLTARSFWLGHPENR